MTEKVPFFKVLSPDEMPAAVRDAGKPSSLRQALEQLAPGDTMCVPGSVRTNVYVAAIRLGMKVSTHMVDGMVYVRRTA